WFNKENGIQQSLPESTFQFSVFWVLWGTFVEEMRRVTVILKFATGDAIEELIDLTLFIENIFVQDFQFDNLFSGNDIRYFFELFHAVFLQN
ncbi:MAG: hypothetical protein DWQ02_01000, partial [Bacteroidetes bacterium]